MDAAHLTIEKEPVIQSVDHRKGIIAFLAIAFGLAWIPFLLVLIQPGASATAPILMPFAPAIACFVVRKWITREGFGDAGLRLNLRRWPLYLVALLWPFTVIPLRAPLTLLLHLAPSRFTIPWGLASTPSISDLAIWSLGSILLAPIIFGEEFGWRGYLQMRLLAEKPFLAAAATGAIWGVWHYPLILIGTEPAQNRLATLLLFPVATIIFSLFLGWLRSRTGSVWAGSVAHAANNGLEDNLNTLTFTGHVGGTVTTGLSLASILVEAFALLGIMAADLIWRRRKEARNLYSGAISSSLTPRQRHDEVVRGLELLDNVR